jgi:hypothetical protein
MLCENSRLQCIYKTCVCVCVCIDNILRIVIIVLPKRVLFWFTRCMCIISSRTQHIEYIVRYQYVKSVRSLFVERWSCCSLDKTINSSFWWCARSIVCWLTKQYQWFVECLFEKSFVSYHRRRQDNSSIDMTHESCYVCKNGNENVLFSWSSTLIYHLYNSIYSCIQLTRVKSLQVMCRMYSLAICSTTFNVIDEDDRYRCSLSLVVPSIWVYC